MKPYYDDGVVTIYHGDCRDVLPMLREQVFDLVLTDPPYGVSYDSNRVPGRASFGIANDGTRLSLRLYRQVLPLLRATHLCWFTRWDAWPDVWEILGQWYPVRGLLIWDKGHNGMGDLKHWGPSYELIASAGAGRIRGGRDGSVLRFPPVSNSKRRHPNEKPVELLRYLTEKLGARSLLDPFMGSGSSLVAARQLGIRAIGIELDEPSCETAARRVCGEAGLGSACDAG